MRHTLVVDEAPMAAQRQTVLTPLDAYNVQHGVQWLDRPFAILLRDDATGSDVGGLWGMTRLSWCAIELIGVPEHLRRQGYGRALMAAAETIARARGCIGLHLSTLEIQAPGFYAKLGYEVFGVLDDYPPGCRHFFLRKRLPPQ